MVKLIKIFELMSSLLQVQKKGKHKETSVEHNETVENLGSPKSVPNDETSRAETFFRKPFLFYK